MSTVISGIIISIEGVVVGGSVGRTIGFPTATLIYVNPMVDSLRWCLRSNVWRLGRLYAGMHNIGGYWPTLDNGSKKVLRFTSFVLTKIFMKKIRLYFVSRIRSEMKFSGLDELIAQLKRDAAFVDRFCPR